MYITLSYIPFSDLSPFLIAFLFLRINKKKHNEKGEIPFQDIMVTVRILFR